MKCILLLLEISCLTFYLSAQGKRLVILHTNDLHSHLQGGSPEIDYTPLTLNDDSTTGGFSRIAGIIKTEKEKNNATIVVDAGDFLMGTLFQSMEMNTGFQLQLMQQMGYDAIALGNHEFDFSIEELTKYINTANAEEIPQLLLSNIKFSKKETSDDAFEVLYNNNDIKRYHIIEKDGLKIGLFALLGDEAFEVANAKPLRLEKQTKTARHIVKILRKKEEVDIVIALSHSGIWFDKNNKLMMIEDAKLAKKADGIDVIISAHTHTKIDTPININNTLITQAGEYGKQVGKLTLTIDEKGVNIEDYKLIPVDDSVLGDAEIQSAIEQQKALLETEILAKLNYEYDQASFELDYDMEYDPFDLVRCNIGNFVADAINYNVNQNIKPHNDISVIGHGMIRDPLHSGTIHLSEIFKTTSLGLGEDAVPGYPLARISLTPREIKRLMGLLIKASEKSINYFMFTSGLKIDYKTNGGTYAKISKIQIADENGVFHPIDCSKKNDQLYSIVADAYMISFLARIKKMSFGLINIVPKNDDGKVYKDIKDAIIDFDKTQPGIQEGKAWLSIIEYAQSFQRSDKEHLPHIPETYKTANLRIRAIN